MDLVQNNRQQVSELFFSLVILLFVDRKVAGFNKLFLLVLFSMGVIVSHYGLGTGYVGYLLIASLLTLFIRSRPGQRIWSLFTGRSHPLPEDVKLKAALPAAYVLLICLFTLAFMLIYYAGVTSGAALSGTGVVTYTASVVASTDISTYSLLNKEPLALTAIGLDFFSVSPPGQAWRTFQYLVELLLTAGMLGLVFRPSGTCPRIKVEYVSLIIVSFVILLGIYLLPIRSYGLGVTRIFQITLLLIAPMFVVGSKMAGTMISRLLSWLRGIFKQSYNTVSPALVSALVILIVFVPYYSFNSGLIFEATKHSTTNFIDIPFSISLSNQRIDISSSFDKQDVSAAGWVTGAAGDNYTMISDYQGIVLFYQYGYAYGNKYYQMPLMGTEQLACPGYLLFRSRNNRTGTFTISTTYAGRQLIPFADIPAVHAALGSNNLVYHNGRASIMVGEKCPD